MERPNCVVIAVPITCLVLDYSTNASCVDDLRGRARIESVYVCQAVLPLVRCHWLIQLTSPLLILVVIHHILVVLAKS